MKIKAIARICAQGGRIIIFDQKDEDGEVTLQWIGDGCALYPAFNLPYVEEESIFAIFDVPKKKQTDYFFEQRDIPEGVDLHDAVPCENMIDYQKIQMIYAGRTLSALETQRGITFIDTKYLAPLGNMEAIELYERIQTDGQPYFVAKAGLMVMAVIMPYDIVSEDFVKQLEDLTRGCQYALKYKIPELRAASPKGD